MNVVQYGDFQCPFCKQAHVVVKRLLATTPGVQLVFRHFPLSQTHPYALSAAYAAEAAGKQGKFWEMHDMLLENQDRVSDAEILTFAQELELDMDAFMEGFHAPETAERVRAQFLGGVECGVKNTPTFFVNGVRYEGPLERLMPEEKTARRTVRK